MESPEDIYVKSRKKFLGFSLLGISIVAIISFFSLQFYNDVVSQQASLQKTYFTLSNQLKVMSDIATLSDNLDDRITAENKKSNQKKIEELLKRLKRENKIFRAWLEKNNFPSIKNIESVLESSQASIKMDNFIDTAEELAENKNLNSKDALRKIKTITYIYQEELGEIFSAMATKLQIDQGKALEKFDSLGIALVSLCLLQIILMWLLVFRPLYTTIFLQHQKISESLLEAQSASRSKTDFLANISHEIRTPMTAIIGYSEILKSDTTSVDEKEEAASIIDKNATHLLSLLDEILNISKIESGKLDFEKEKINLPAVLNDVYSLINVKANEKDIELVFDNKGSFPKFINTDEKRLKQILFNILGNAIKFTSKGYVHLSISYREKLKRVIFRVKDTGTGISKSQMKNIFKPFGQADTSVNRKFGGTGLGLVLSRGLAREMGGDVKIRESKPGVGTTFEISLDAGVEDIEMTNTFSTNIVEEDSAFENINEHTLKGSKILVVDDAKENARLFMAYLQQAGGEVEIAHDGSEALEKAQEDIDIVLLDLQMPIMDGFQVIKELKKRNFQSPVLALTAHAMDEEKQRTRDAGFQDHITKPVKPDVLINIVAWHLS